MTNSLIYNFAGSFINIVGLNRLSSIMKFFFFFSLCVHKQGWLIFYHEIVWIIVILPLKMSTIYNIFFLSLLTNCVIVSFKVSPRARRHRSIFLLATGGSLERTKWKEIMVRSAYLTDRHKQLIYQFKTFLAKSEIPRNQASALQSSCPGLAVPYHLHFWKLDKS